MQQRPINMSKEVFRDSRWCYENSIFRITKYSLWRDLKINLYININMLFDEIINEMRAHIMNALQRIENIERIVTNLDEKISQLSKS